MRSNHEAIRLPHPVRDLGERMMKKRRTKNFVRYLTALILEDGMRERRWATYRVVANADDGEQDELIDFLLKFPEDDHAIHDLMCASLKHLKT